MGETNVFKLCNANKLDILFQSNRLFGNKLSDKKFVEELREQNLGLHDFNIIKTVIQLDFNDALYQETVLEELVDEYKYVLEVIDSDIFEEPEVRIRLYNGDKEVETSLPGFLMPVYPKDNTLDKELERAMKYLKWQLYESGLEEMSRSSWEVSKVYEGIEISDKNWAVDVEKEYKSFINDPQKYLKDISKVILNPLVSTGRKKKNIISFAVDIADAQKYNKNKKSLDSILETLRRMMHSIETTEEDPGKYQLQSTPKKYFPVLSKIESETREVNKPIGLSHLKESNINFYNFLWDKTTFDYIVTKSKQEEIESFGYEELDIEVV